MRYPNAVLDVITEHGYDHMGVEWMDGWGRGGGLQMMSWMAWKNMDMTTRAWSRRMEGCGGHTQMLF